MKEFILFLLHYPFWVRMTVVILFGIIVVILVAFRPNQDKPDTKKTNEIPTDSAAITAGRDVIAGRDVVVNVNSSSYTESKDTQGNSGNTPSSTSTLKLPQTTEELEGNLREQIHFLQRSSQYFDSGYKDEAKRMAASLCILLYNRQETPSLLSQLRIQEDIQFLDTASEDRPGNLASYNGLCTMQFSAKTTNADVFQPKCIFPLRKPLKWTSFNTWWDKVILDDHKGVSFSRGALLLSVAKGDGGLSVDSTLDSEYVKLSRKNSLRWFFSNGRQDKPILGVELAVIRQITYEFLFSFEKKFPKYFTSQ